MAKIYQVSGSDKAISCPPDKTKGFTMLNQMPGETTEGHMDLLIARDNMVTKKNIVAGLHGIGSIKAQKYQNSIDVLDDAIHGLDQEDSVGYMAKIEDDILQGRYGLHDQMAGIGDVTEIGRARGIHKERRRAARRVEIQAEAIAEIGKKSGKSSGGGGAKKVSKARTKLRDMKTKTGKFIKKAAEKTKKGLKTLAKAATLPQRLVVKGILEITLPKAAPFFLYLFINDPAIIAKLPAKVATKRAKQLKIKNFIVNVIGMKDAHFMGIVRNGIMKKHGASPETILSKQLRGISGVGVVDMAADFVVQLIQKLVTAFKKKKEEAPDVTADDAPADGDFGNLSETEKTELSTDIKKQNDLPDPTEEKSNDGGDGGKEGTGKGTQKRGEDKGSPRSEGGGGGEGSGSGGGSGSEDNTPTNDTDANGEIKAEADAKGPEKDFETGGRKEWNSLGK